jgi:hypothetical protein
MGQVDKLEKAYNYTKNPTSPPIGFSYISWNNAYGVHFLLLCKISGLVTHLARVKNDMLGVYGHVV